MNCEYCSYYWKEPGEERPHCYYHVWEEWDSYGAYAPCADKEDTADDVMEWEEEFFVDADFCEDDIAFVFETVGGTLEAPTLSLFVQLNDSREKRYTSTKETPDVVLNWMSNRHSKKQGKGRIWL